MTTVRSDGVRGPGLEPRLATSQPWDLEGWFNLSVPQFPYLTANLTGPLWGLDEPICIKCSSLWKRLNVNSPQLPLSLGGRKSAKSGWSSGGRCVPTDEGRPDSVTSKKSLKGVSPKFKCHTITRPSRVSEERRMNIDAILSCGLIGNRADLRNKRHGTPFRWVLLKLLLAPRLPLSILKRRLRCGTGMGEREEAVIPEELSALPYFYFIWLYNHTKS